MVIRLGNYRRPGVGGGKSRLVELGANLFQWNFLVSRDFLQVQFVFLNRERLLVSGDEQSRLELFKTC